MPRDKMKKKWNETLDRLRAWCKYHFPTKPEQFKNGYEYGCQQLADARIAFEGDAAALEDYVDYLYDCCRGPDPFDRGMSKALDECTLPL